MDARSSTTRAARAARRRGVRVRPRGADRPDPRRAAPAAGATALRGAGIDAPLRAPGRGARGGLGRPDDRHDRHRVGQVAVLQPADARRAAARRQGARALPLPDQGARAGPGARDRAARPRQTASARRSTTATRRARRAARSAAARTSSSPTPTCSTSASCPTTTPGRRCSPTSRSSSSTRRTSTAACSARTSPTCCAGCAGSPPRTAPSRASCSPRRRSPTRVELAERLTGLDDVALIDARRLAVGGAADRDLEPAGDRRGARRAALGAGRGRRAAGAARRRGRAHDLLRALAASGAELLSRIARDELERARRGRAARAGDALPRRLHAGAAARGRGAPGRRASCARS